MKKTFITKYRFIVLTIGVLFNLYWNGKIIAQNNSVSHDHDHEFIKCLTPLIIQLHNEAVDPNHPFIQKLKSNPQPSFQSHAEFLSPSGKFRIHYVTVGSDRVPSDDFNSNGIPDYVEEVAEAADSSYNHEIMTLGFTNPINDGEVYDIFIENLANFGAYGLTNNRTSGSFACNSSGPGTCIYIENDFAGYPPNTDPEGDVIGSIKVTVAHELKHAIQFVQNDWNGDSDRWAEMDATLMEEVVYDDVNDYYNYITGFSTDLFNSPASSLTAGSYEDITWALYFHERFGEDFWPSAWEIIEADIQTPLVTAIETELIQRTESYSTALIESYMWHFASGPNFSGKNYGFEERLEYPNPSISATYLELQPDLTNNLNLNPFSARYYLADLTVPTYGFAKLNFAISSDDVHIGLLAYFDDGSVETQIVTGNNNRLTSSIDTDWAWGNVDKIGLVVMNGNPASNNTYSFQFTEYFISKKIQLAQNFPNPFNPSTTIRLSIPQNQNVTLDVYDVLGRHIQTIYEGPVNAGFQDFTFDASSLSSGVYIYQLQSELGVQTKSMTLIK